MRKIMLPFIVIAASLINLSLAQAQQSTDNPEVPADRYSIGQEVSAGLTHFMESDVNSLVLNYQIKHHTGCIFPLSVYIGDIKGFSAGIGYETGKA